MSDVIPLFKSSTVQDALCEAADLGLTEIILIGKKPSGRYWVRFSPCQNIFEQLGMVEMLKHDIMTTIDANSED